MGEGIKMRTHLLDDEEGGSREGKRRELSDSPLGLWQLHLPSIAGYQERSRRMKSISGLRSIIKSGISFCVRLVSWWPLSTTTSFGRSSADDQRGIKRGVRERESVSQSTFFFPGIHSWMLVLELKQNSGELTVGVWKTEEGTTSSSSVGGGSSTSKLNTSLQTVLWGIVSYFAQVPQGSLHPKAFSGGFWYQINLFQYLPAI